jgi:hypothetical protein
MFEEAKDSLRDSILLYTYGKIVHIVDSIQKTFVDYQDRFEDFITTMFGVNDPAMDENQFKVGSHILTLYQATKGYDKSVGQLYSLIHLASAAIEKFPSLQKDIASVLGGGKFPHKLFQLICTLSFPKRAHSTFVLMAQTSASFRRVKICTKSNMKLLRQSPTASRSKASPRTTTPSPKKSPIIPLSTRTTPAANSSQKNAQAAPRMTLQHRSREKPSETPPLDPHADILTVIRPYLAEEDRAIGLARLQPASKQDTARLTGAVLRRNLLPLSANAWYAFGFVTTGTEEEERRLAGFYADILQATQNSDPISVFTELVQALETNKLAQLFDKKGYAHFRQLFPRLEHFLSAPPERRSTVWRLIHFIRDEGNTEPPASLQRDYGFWCCQQRDEVSRLKNHYAAILEKVNPMDLHNACTNGRLYEFARETGVLIDLKDKRLMQNNAPALCVGFDNQIGLAAFRGRFYKRSL